MHEVRAVRFPHIGSAGNTLRGLRDDARITAKSYHHNMSRWNANGIAICKDCKALMQVDGTPALGVNLSGEALKRDCTA